MYALEDSLGVEARTSMQTLESVLVSTVLIISNSGQQKYPKSTSLSQESVKVFRVPVIVTRCQRKYPDTQLLPLEVS